ncbi:MAG: hypothetical protein WC718_00035 [Phycisphaerales bacterium]|jgi:hypothetical protein
MNTHDEAAPKRHAHIPQELEELHCAAKELHDLVDRLENQLGPVTRMEPPGVEGKEVPESELVGHADAIRQARRSIHGAGCRIASLIDRLEV